MKRIDGTQIIRADRANQYGWRFELKDGVVIIAPCTLQGWIHIAEMEPPQGISCAHYLHDTTPREPEYEGDKNPLPEVTVGQFYGMKNPRPDVLIEMINEHGPKEAPEAIITLCNRWQPMPVSD